MRKDIADWDALSGAFQECVSLMASSVGVTKALPCYDFVDFINLPG